MVSFHRGLLLLALYCSIGCSSTIFRGPRPDPFQPAAASEPIQADRHLSAGTRRDVSSEVIPVRNETPALRLASDGGNLAESPDEILTRLDTETAAADFRFGDDLSRFPKSLWLDTRALATVPNALILGSAGAGAAVSAENLDDVVRRDTARHHRRMGGLNNVLDVAGHPITHAGVAGGLYAASLITDDPDLHTFSGSLVNSLVLSNAAAISLKYAFGTDRPDGEPNGFPSGHTASSFAVAACIEEQFGLMPGLGAYAVAGLVGLHRIDNRKHDVSDVLFGAALGYVIGKSTAHRHLASRPDVSIGPYTDIDNGTTGVYLEKRY